MAPSAAALHEEFAPQSKFVTNRDEAVWVPRRRRAPPPPPDEPLLFKMRREYPMVDQLIQLGRARLNRQRATDEKRHDRALLKQQARSKEAERQRLAHLGVTAATTGAARPPALSADTQVGVDSSLQRSTEP